MPSHGSASEIAVHLEILRLRGVLDSLVARINALTMPQQARATIQLLETLTDAGVACGRDLPIEGVA